MQGKLFRPVFWALVGIFIIWVGMMFLGRGLIPYGLLVIGVVFALLGGVLLFLMVKTEVRGILKVFLLLTGASAVGLPISAFLHNVVSALFNVEEPVFFMMAVFVCPLGFLVGAVGTIVINIKSKQAKQPS